MAVRSQEAGVRAEVERSMDKGNKGVAIARCLGFWMLWQAYGGMQQIVDAGLMSRRNAYYSRGDFLAVIGCSPDEWRPDLALLVRDE